MERGVEENVRLRADVDGLLREVNGLRNERDLWLMRCT